MSSIDPLIRLVYGSRSTAAPAQRAVDVASILATARAFNPAHGLTGLLVVSGAQYLQALEGPSQVVHALYERIGADARHSDINLLALGAIKHRAFPIWSMGLMTRTEPESAAAERAAVLKQRLAEDPNVRPDDFFRCMVTPGVSTGSDTRSRQQAVMGVAFTSPNGLWSAAVLQHIAGHSLVRTGRTHVADALDPGNRTLVEYVDLEAPDAGQIRAFSLTRDPAQCIPLAPLMDRLDLLVLMLASSDLSEYESYLASWIALPQVQNARPHLLIVSALPAERIEGIVRAVQSTTGFEVSSARLKLGDAEAVWNATQDALRELAARRLAQSAEVAEAAASVDVPAWPENDTGLIEPGAPATPEEPEDLAHSSAAPSRRQLLCEAARVSGCLQQLLALDGSLQALLLETDPPGLLAREPHSKVDANHAVAAAEFLMHKRLLVQRLGLGESTEDIAVTTSTHLHLYRPLQQWPTVFLSVTLDRDRALIASVRLKMREIESHLTLQASRASSDAPASGA